MKFCCSVIEDMFQCLVLFWGYFNFFCFKSSVFSINKIQNPLFLF